MSLSTKLNIQDLDLKNKRVLIRVDYNVPLNNDLKVEDPRRIEETIPTIDLALKKGAKSIVLVSHLGRPNGQKSEKYSLKNIVPVLQTSLKNVTQQPITFIESFESDEYQRATKSPRDKEVFLLENLRFHIEEEGSGVTANGEKVKAEKAQVDAFRKKLSALGDVFVFDAFAAAHRAHSSVVGVELDQRAAGLLMSKELTAFSKIMESPKRPFLSILGGAKVSDKILLIENLLNKVDEMIIGGGMAYTFLKVMKGIEIGTSLYDAEGAKIVTKLVKKAEEKNVKLHFPIDFVAADKFNPEANTRLCDAEKGITPEWMGLDCGEKSIKLFSEVISRSKTVVWNGPLGVFEFEKFSNGTKQCLISLAEATERDSELYSVIGGGDTASAAEKFGVAQRMSHISTGGGASLELLEGKVLPGIQNLSEAKQ